MGASEPHTGRVLIGEDTVDIAYVMQRALEDAGYLVETASDGVACLERARDTLPDLVVLDIMMPRMHGIDVLKSLKSDPATRDIGVLICTAKDFPTEHEKCRQYGATDVLVKPFDASQLTEKVAAYFAGKGAPPPETDPTPQPGEAETELYVPVLGTRKNSFTLWGARGSTPTPGARFLRHGGNTSCFSVSSGEECFIFDAGSGVRELGLQLAEGPLRHLHLFITHTHWDHIQGFPFFTPAYLPDFHITIYGAEGFGKDLRSIFRGQLDRDYFPVQMEDMNAEIEFRHLPEEPMSIGPATVSWGFAEHPGATVGYRIEVGGRSIVWVPDNEFLLGYLGDPRRLERDDWRVQPFEAFIRFLTDTDLVIHEAQYTTTEYPEKVRWGHSSISNAALLMKLADVRRWLVTHHDPLHDDDFLETKLHLTREILHQLEHDIQVSHGFDGMTEYF